MEEISVRQFVDPDNYGEELLKSGASRKGKVDAVTKQYAEYEEGTNLTGKKGEVADTGRKQHSNHDLSELVDNEKEEISVRQSVVPENIYEDNYEEEMVKAGASRKGKVDAVEKKYTKYEETGLVKKVKLLIQE